MAALVYFFPLLPGGMGARGKDQTMSPLPLGEGGRKGSEIIRRLRITD
jgi:hypothetical protein